MKTSTPLEHVIQYSGGTDSQELSFLVSRLGLAECTFSRGETVLAADTDPRMAIILEGTCEINVPFSSVA